MLTEISVCRNFMDIKKMIELLKLLNSSSCSLVEIKKYFNNDIIILKNLEDTIVLLQNIEVLEIDDGIYKLSDMNWAIDSENLIEKLLISIITKKVVLFSNIDTEGFLAISYNLYALRNLLLSENIIKNYPISNLYILNPEHSSAFERFKSKKVSKEKLLENIEKQSEYGEMAELLVIDYEKKLLGNEKPIIHVALENASAGYDIKSYIKNSSNVHDKFIEVKCYSSKTTNFYISRNEIETSEKLNSNYFLYLVESSFTKPPIIIQNPFKKIFNNNQISRVVESYRFDAVEVIKSLNITSE